jgi:hypothetical protein
MTLLMRFLGYTGREFFRIGFAAVGFILLLKFLAPKAQIPALSSTVEKI